MEGSGADIDFLLSTDPKADIELASISIHAGVPPPDLPLSALKITTPEKTILFQLSLREDHIE
jgi:hypothetical protein